MGTDSAPKAEDKDDPMEGPSKKEESSSEELVPDDPGRAHRSASKVPRQFKAATHVAPPAATMAAFTDEAPVIPDAEADGTYACPDCDKSADSLTLVLWLASAAPESKHSMPLTCRRLPEHGLSPSFRHLAQSSVEPK